MSKQKKSNLPLIIVTAIIVCAAIIVAIITKNSGTSGSDSVAQNGSGSNTVLEGNVNSNSQDTGNSSTGYAQTIEEGESLVIPVDEVTEVAQFYPIEVDGTEMEIIAVKDSSGSIRTAFNTCQICYSSGRGYYVQDGNEIVCQNCGNRFTVDQIEVEIGGCNPYPIFDENKTVTEDSILIPYDFLKETTGVFANWKN